MRATALLLITAVSSAGVGCGADYGTGRVCTAVAVPALDVTVLDGATGQRVCDATVVAAEGSFSGTLDPFPGTGTCSYSGPYERAGVYEVRVTKQGYQPAVERNVRVTSDECHVLTRRVTVTLVR
jgi:hypothetical protein